MEIELDTLYLTVGIRHVDDNRLGSVWATVDLEPFARLYRCVTDRVKHLVGHLNP
jgi:hypothetical protein